MKLFKVHKIGISVPNATHHSQAATRRSIKKGALYSIKLPNYLSGIIIVFIRINLRREDANISRDKNSVFADY